MFRPSFRRRRRHVLCATPVVVLLCALAATSAAPAQAAAPTKLPDQGMYDSCDPVTSPDKCASRLRRLSECRLQGRA